MSVVHYTTQMDVELNTFVNTHINTGSEKLWRTFVAYKTYFSKGISENCKTRAKRRTIQVLVESFIQETTMLKANTS